MKVEYQSFVKGSTLEPAMLVLLLERFDHGEAIGESADTELPEFHAGARGVVGIDHLGKIAGGFEGIGHLQGTGR